MFLRFLITYEFYSRMGFLISYTMAFLLVLELVRLICTDVNKREIEKMLDSYSKSRTEVQQDSKSSSSSNRLRKRRVPISNLDKRPQATYHQPRVTSPAATPDSERTLINEERRRRRAQSSASQYPPTAHVQYPPTPTPTPTPTPPPTRRLRKRSDTLMSSGSPEVRKSERRRREVSPVSLADSKTSSRNASPKPPRKVRDKEAQQLSSSLHKVLRQRGEVR